MEKKYQIFISSTYSDLKEERQKVAEAVLNAGHVPVSMELLDARNGTQKELIEEWIELSDIYILILGGRYGYLDDNGQGYTHWEYRKAGELGKPRLSLVLTEEYLKQKVIDGKIKATDLEFPSPKIKEFRSEVMGKMVSLIDNIEKIEAEVIKSVNRIINEQSDNLKGWVKGSVLSELKDTKPSGSSSAETKKVIGSSSVEAIYEQMPMQRILQKAKHEIFISGFTLIEWAGYFNQLQQLAENGINVKLLVTNTYDKSLLENFEKLLGHPVVVKSLKHLIPYMDKSNIEIRVINSILPTSFVAYDMECPTGYIKAEHLLNGHLSIDYPNIEQYTGGAWYYMYKNSIKTCWGRGVDFKKFIQTIP